MADAGVTAVATPVSDSRSNKHEQIAHAAEVLTGSELRIRVFEEIYKGKRAVKSRSDLEATTGLNNKQVLNAGKRLVDNDLVEQVAVDGQVAYRKDPFYSTHKARILKLARDPKKLAAQPRSAHVKTANNQTTVTIRAPQSLKAPRMVAVDDIDSFSKVRDLELSGARRLDVSEDAVKSGLQRVIGDEGEFKDWGGELNDISTSRVVLNGKRVQAAMALKGPAQTGKLTPGKMGKNGDQAQRLFAADAQLYVVQYIGEIHESVLTLTHALAVAKATTTTRQIYYCVIDGQDTDRLMRAYPEEFAP